MTITSYLEFILHEIDKEVESTFKSLLLQIKKRASQLSVLLHGEGRSLFEYLMKNGVITDWREPNVIRLAPVPLYSSFEDMYHFEILKRVFLINKVQIV
jgi:kynureninase